MDYKDKIRKLLALAKSPEPEEAKLALLKARKLMAEHKLSERDLEERNTTVIKRAIGEKFSKKANSWMDPLSIIIGENYCCSAFRCKISAKTTVWHVGFIGLEGDIEICVKIFRYAVRCIKSEQKKLRNYMLPWFSPFAAPWCGKIQRAFPKAYVTMNFELILVPRTNTYINLNHCSTPDEFKAEVIEGVSRFAFKGFTKPLCREHLDGINKLLDTHFTPEEIEYIYTNLGNGINHELCMKFVKSEYDLKVIEESV